LPKKIKENASLESEEVTPSKKANRQNYTTKQLRTTINITLKLAGTLYQIKTNE
jgi:hypothetical protein